MHTEKLAEDFVNLDHLKRQEDMRNHKDLIEKLMHIVLTYKDTRYSAMSFIKLEEVSMWMQVMIQGTEINPASLEAKKES